MKFYRRFRMMKKMTALLVAAVIGMLSVTSVMADSRTDLENAKAARSAAENTLSTTRSEIESARQAQAAAEDSLNAANSRISSMKGEQEALQVYLTQLNSQLSELSESLTNLNKQIDDKNLEIEMARAAIVRAQNDEANQYEDMMKRIKYMYENGATSFLETLCEAENISEFLNRADEFTQLQEYDRKLLDDYKTACATVKKKEAALEVEEEELESLKAEAEAQQAEVKTLAETTDSEIARYTEAISEEELEASSLQQQIDAQVANLAALEEKARKAEEDRQRADEEATRAAALIAQQEEAARLAREAAARAAAEEARRAEQARLNSAAQASTAGNTSFQPSAAAGRYLGRFKITAYCPCAQCCGRAGAATASGVQPRVGHTVAMGGLPFGTKLMINGVVYTVEDRGTPYGHVDIFMGSHGECLQFGLRYMDVYLVE